MTRRAGFSSVVLLLCAVVLCKSCIKEDVKPNPDNKEVGQGNDPNFKIIANADKAFSAFNRKVEVFGIPIYAVRAVEDIKLLHAANIMAQYLDNNEDGKVDNEMILNAMLSKKAFMILWKKESDIENIEPPTNTIGQDLGNDETKIEWHTNGHEGAFDAALEEVFHIITNAGYAVAYPEIFGEKPDTPLTNAMDKARGGRFATVPKPYPDSAWYTYDDTSCDYNCMASEYIYWGMTSILGAQENRLSEIENEWKLNTVEKVKNTDTGLYALLTDAQYKFPTKLPDGTYKR